MRALIVILILIASFPPNCAFAQTWKENTDETAQRIKRFYTFYITEEEGMPDKKKINDTLDHYFTKAYLKKMRSEKEIEADPILNVQDFDKRWVSTLTVTKVADKTNMYKVCFFETYTKEDHCVTVSLKKEAGLWKIDKVSY